MVNNYTEISYVVFQVVEIENKGRGVIASKIFKRGDFVVEYAGDLIDLKTAKQKEADYSKDPDIGCYMYYFTHKSVNYWLVHLNLDLIFFMY